MFVDIISAEEALSKFREYYTSVWPALIVIHILAIIVFVCLFKRTKHSDKIISVILAFLWFWDGIVHQCILAAYLPEHWIPMTIMLVIQGMLIFYHGVLKSNLSFNYTKGTGKSVLGVFFMIYALIGYLILGFILGHPFTEGGVFFANICAFDVFTLGLLMMSGNKTPKYIVIIPLVWALLGGLLAAFVWHIWEDLGLVTAGIISSVIVFRRKRIENRVNTAVHGNKYLGACTLSARITHQKYHAEHSNQFMFKTALLSISLLTIMAGAGVAPGISKIAYAFPDVSETMIKMVLSIPPLFMIFASLITGKLSTWIKKRLLLVTGLLLFLVGGVGAGYVNSFNNLLIFRAILGIGTGMILPFSTGIIGECYAEEQKTKMMGYSFAANNFGVIIATLVAGVLAAISWNYMFHVYWIGLPVTLLVMFFLTNLPEGQSIEKEKSVLPIKVYGIAFFAIPTNLSLLISVKEIGTVKLAGIILAINALTMLMAGILLLKIKKALKKSFLPVILLFIVLGFLGIACSSTALILILSIIISGLGLGSLFPYILNALSESVETEQNMKTMSVGMAAAWMGQFLSPIILDNISRLFGGEITRIFQVIAFIMLLACVFTFVKFLLEKWNAKK